MTSYLRVDFQARKLTTQQQTRSSTVLLSSHSIKKLIIGVLNVQYEISLVENMKKMKYNHQQNEKNKSSDAVTYMYFCKDIY